MSSMFQKGISLAAAFYAIALLFTPYSANAQDNGKKHKLIIAFTAPDSVQQKAVLNLLSNLREELPHAKISVIAYNKGLDLLLNDNRYAAKVKKLSEQGIEFLACGNTMKMRNILPEQVVPFAAVVKAGIAEIVKRQEKGWTYIVGGF